MRVLFRCDAGETTGYGHLMRCRTLAEQLSEAGCDVKFACREQKGFDSRWLPYSIIQLPAGLTPEEEANQISACLLEQKIDWLIVDHYELSANWLARLPDNVKKMVLDDLCREQQGADLLCDQSLGRQAEDYDGKVSADCTLLTGINFCLLAPAYRARRKEAEKKRLVAKQNHLLISVGATDHLNLSERILGILSQLPDSLFPRVSFVLSSKAPFYKSLKTAIDSMATSRDIRLLSDVQDMASLVSECDFAIGACGTSSWERACLGLPSLCAVTADNQKFIANQMEQAGICQLFDIKMGDKELVSRLKHASTKQNMHQMSEAGLQLVDAQGVQRVASALLRQSHCNVRLRSFEAEDKTLIYRWQCQPGNRKHARTPRPPTQEEHQRWFQAVMEAGQPDYIICYGDLPCGLIRLTPREIGWEVSVLLSQHFHQLGIAANALKALQARHKVTMHADISPENEASIKLFTGAGFTRTSERHYIYKANN